MSYSIATSQRALAGAILTLTLAPIPALDAQPAASDKAPRIEVVVAQADLGQRPRGETIGGRIEIKNTGSAPLQIEAITPTVPSVAVQFDRTVQPGAKATATWKVDTLDLLGPIQLRFAVKSNDPATPVASAGVNFEVVTALRITPGEARYHYVRYEPEGTIPQTMWALGQDDFRVLAVESPYPYVRVSFREAAEAERAKQGVGRQWRIEITLDDEAPVGPLVKPVVIRTNHPMEPWLTIPVSGMVRPVFAVTPPEGQFDPPLAISTEPVRVYFDVRNFATAKVPLSKVESSVSWIEATLEPLIEGHRYRMVVTLKPEAPKGPFRTTLRIPTSHPKEPVIEVQLHGTII